MIYDEYEHCKCSCGGIIGMTARDLYGGFFRCDKCGKTYAAWKLKYDFVATNSKTGWIFPMKRRDDK